MSIYKGATKLTGNTYQYRELFRRLGGKWNAEEKAWYLPPLTMRERSTMGPLRGVVVERA